MLLTISMSMYDTIPMNGPFQGTPSLVLFSFSLDKLAELVKCSNHIDPGRESKVVIA